MSNDTFRLLVIPLQAIATPAGSDVAPQQRRNRHDLTSRSIAVAASMYIGCEHAVLCLLMITRLTFPGYSCLQLHHTPQLLSLSILLSLSLSILLSFVLTVAAYHIMPSSDKIPMQFEQAQSQ